MLVVRFHLPLPQDHLYQFSVAECVCSTSHAVPKRPKGAACKAVVRQFESGPRVQTQFFRRRSSVRKSSRLVSGRSQVRSRAGGSSSFYARSSVGRARRYERRGRRFEPCRACQIYARSVRKVAREADARGLLNRWSWRHGTWVRLPDFPPSLQQFLRGVAQSGQERLFWEQEAQGSNPCTPTSWFSFTRSLIAQR